MEKSDIKALTFDLFGTILDLGGSLTPYIAEFLRAKGVRTYPRTGFGISGGHGNASNSIRTRL